MDLDILAQEIIYLQAANSRRDMDIQTIFQLPMLARYDVYSHITEQLVDDLTRDYGQFKPDTVGRAG